MQVKIIPSQKFVASHHPVHHQYRLVHKTRLIYPWYSNPMEQCWLQGVFFINHPMSFACIISTVSRPPMGLMSLTTTLAPSAAKRLDVARPIPEPDAVINNTKILITFIDIRR